MDVAGGRSLREHWRHVTLELPVLNGDPLRELVQPAFEWLDQEDEREQNEADFRQASDSLSYALDRNVSLEELVRYHRAATQYGMELSDLLVDRYGKRVESLQQQASRQQKTRVAMIGSGAVLAVCVVAVAIYIPVRTSTINTHVERLENLIDQVRFDDADDYLAKLSTESPSIATSARVQDLELRLKGLRKTEAERQAAFQQVADQVATELTFMRLDPALLERLRTMAKTAIEKTRLRELESQTTKVADQSQAKRDEEFLAQVKVFVYHVNAVEKEGSTKPGELRQRVSKLRAELEALEASTSGVSGKARAPLTSLRSRLQSINAQISRGEDQEARQSQITNSIGDRDRFRGALEAYASEFAEGDRAADFRKVVEESKLWPAVDAWNTLMAQCQSKPFADLTPEDAAEQAKLTAKFIEEFKSFPASDVLGERLPYLSAIGQRSENGQRLELKLARLFADPLVADLWLVAHKDGRRFYGRSEPKLEADRLNGFKYVVQFDFTEKGIGLRTGDVTETGLAPQSKIAKDLSQMVSQVTDKTWDRTFFTMLDKIHNEPGMDPILRLNLLQQTHEIGRQGSLVFEKTFDDYAAVLKGSRVDAFANWLDPANEEAKDQRRRAEEVIEKLPDFKKAVARAQTEGGKVRRPVGRSYRWVGWLRRTPPNVWSCEAETRPAGTGDLFVVSAAAGGTVAIDAVGQVTEGNVQIKPFNNNVLVEGRPLYFSPTQK